MLPYVGTICSGKWRIFVSFQRVALEQVQYLRGRNLSGGPFTYRVVFIQELISRLIRKDFLEFPFCNFRYIFGAKVKAFCRETFRVSDMRSTGCLFKI